MNYNCYLAIVFETLEQLHKGSEVSSTAGYTTNATSTLLSTTIQTISMQL